MYKKDRFHQFGLSDDLLIIGDRCKKLLTGSCKNLLTDRCEELLTAVCKILLTERCKKLLTHDGKIILPRTSPLKPTMKVMS